MAYKAANKPGPSGTSSSGSAKKGVEPGSAEAKLRLAELLKNKPRVDSETFRIACEQLAELYIEEEYYRQAGQLGRLLVLGGGDDKELLETGDSDKDQDPEPEESEEDIDVDATKSTENERVKEVGTSTYQLVRGEHETLERAAESRSTQVRKASIEKTRANCERRWKNESRANKSIELPRKVRALSPDITVGHKLLDTLSSSKETARFGNSPPRKCREVSPDITVGHTMLSQSCGATAAPAPVPVVYRQEKPRENRALSPDITVGHRISPFNTGPKEIGNHPHRSRKNRSTRSPDLD